MPKDDLDYDEMVEMLKSLSYDELLDKAMVMVTSMQLGLVQMPESLESTPEQIFTSLVDIVAKTHGVSIANRIVDDAKLYRFNVEKLVLN